MMAARAAASLLVPFFGLWLAAPVNAGPIFASAPPGPTGLGLSDPGVLGSVYIGAAEVLGMRFYIGSGTQISAAGAYLIGYTDQPMFAAIVPLADGFADPSGSPFDSSTLAYSLFTPGLTTGDYFAPFSITLQPGWYGLVIGAGYFGSPDDAGGLLVQDGSGSPPPMFGWDTLTPPVAWSQYGGTTDYRMFVESAPEPWPASMAIIGLVGIYILQRSSRRDP